MQLAILLRRHANTLNCLCTFVVVATIVTQIGATATAQDKPDSQIRYFVTGVVRDAETDEPISGATIQVLDSLQADEEQRLLKGVTTNEGRYRIEVPMGSTRIWYPPLKPGYWLESKDCVVEVVALPDQPIVNHDIMVKSGPVWRCRIEGTHSERMIAVTEVPDDQNRSKLIKGEYFEQSTPMLQAISYLDDEKDFALTQIGTSGKLVLRVINLTTELIVEPGFDNSQVASVRHLPDSDKTEMLDANGKKTTIGAATVTLAGGIPLLTFQLKPSHSIAEQKVTGRLVDANNKPVADARVGLTIGFVGKGGGDSGKSTISNSDGQFDLELPIQPGLENTTLEFSATIAKDGFAAHDTSAKQAAKDFAQIDFGTIRLKPGNTLPILVVDESGTHVPGAEIEPTNGYALRRQATRTDADGRATLKNLPSGMLGLSVRQGQSRVQTNLMVSDQGSGNPETTVRLKTMIASSESPATPAKPKRLPVGTAAPAFTLTSWTDGKPRKLVDFRGKIVVLDFWGVWCRPCLTAIPAMKELEAKYADDPIVFLGIHTPDGVADQITKLKKEFEWSIATGLDRGTIASDGMTSAAYGVRSYPTTVIVDADGKIAFRSDELVEDREASMKEMETLARQAGIKWPIDENAPVEELMPIINKLIVLQLTQVLERLISR